MQRFLRRFALLGVMAVVGILLLRFTLLRADPVPVTVYVVARGRVEQTVTNSKAGTVKTHHRAKLSPETGGRAADVNVRKGDRVRAGDVLVRLDDAQYRAQVTNAERALDAAKEGESQACLEAGLAERDQTRAEGLASDRIVSEERLDQARSRRDVARASCQAARARARQLASQVEVARAELRKTVVLAPFDGVVAEVSIEPGEWVTPSPPGLPMPAILDLLDPDAIYVSAPLDEVDREKVLVGQPVRITMDAFPGRSFPGRVTRVAPYISDVAVESRTFEVEANFEDAAFARTLPPGASADIEVILDALDNVLRVPTYVVVEGKRVLLLEDECPSDRGVGGLLRGVLSARSGGCLVSRDVTIGLKNWEFAEVRDGLSEGDRVVVSLDRAEVREGARARQAAVTER